MNDTTQLVPLNKQSIQTYANAIRRLRRKVGSKAPTTVELIKFELAGRVPKDVASSYLDHLRDVERRRKIEPGRRPNVPVLRTMAWPGRRPAAPVGDPTRN